MVPIQRFRFHHFPRIEGNIFFLISVNMYGVGTEISISIFILFNSFPNFSLSSFCPFQISIFYKILFYFSLSPLSLSLTSSSPLHHWILLGFCRLDAKFTWWRENPIVWLSWRLPSSSGLAWIMKTSVKTRKICIALIVISAFVSTVLLLRLTASIARFKFASTCIMMSSDFKTFKSIWIVQKFRFDFFSFLGNFKILTEFECKINISNFNFYSFFPYSLILIDFESNCKIIFSNM